MDDRRYFDPRHRPPPTVSPSLGLAPSPTLHHRDVRTNAVSHSHSPENIRYRDHPAYHQPPAIPTSSSSRRAWEDDRRPPPLPMIGSASNSREMSAGHHVPVGSSSTSSFAPPRPSYYDYEQRRPPTHDEDRIRDYEGRLGHSFRGEYDEQDRFQDSRNWRAPVQPSYRRDYYSPESDHDRYQPPAIGIDERGEVPPRPAMSISSLLDSGRGVSPAPPLLIPSTAPKYVSPPVQEEHDYHPQHGARSRMYSDSPSPVEQRRGGAAISNLLDDGDGRRPAKNAKDSLAEHPDARFTLSHLSSAENDHVRSGRRQPRSESVSTGMMDDDTAPNGSVLTARNASNVNSAEPKVIAPAMSAATTNTSGRKSAGSGGRSRQRNQGQSKAKRKVEEEWDSDLSTEENRPLWIAEMTDYQEELLDRMQCIEVAFEKGIIDRQRIVGKRLSLAYRTRFEPVMQRVKSREENERRLREARQRQRKEANRKQREKEIEMELLDTLDDTSYRSKSSKNNRSRSNRNNRGVEEELDDLSRHKKRRIGDDAERGDGEEDDSMLQSRASSPESMLDEEDVPLALTAGLTSTMSKEKQEEQVIEAHRRVWIGLARKDVPKVYRTVQASVTNKAMYWRRVSSVVAREAKRGAARSNRSIKDVQVRARKVMREMLVFWKRNEKEERELRKKAEKEALDKAKKEEEMREAKRQARKLNFLITQTELYSHFVGNKLKTNEAEETEETSGGNKLIESRPADGSDPTIAPIDSQDAEVASAEARLAELKDLDFDDDDEANLRAHARRNAEEAVAAAKAKAVAFDSRAAEERQRLEEQQMQDGDATPRSERRIEEKDLGKAFDQDDLNFLNPTSMGAMDVKQPKMLTCQLKEYQLKGLNWLANLYEQGINGILADEMGLGKTVQSIALMAYLAEVHDIWGPFLVIAPASTLHNWQQEISRFVPSLKALPYWGNVKDRTILRKFWNRKQISYHRDAPFHVLITSYQLVVSDEKYFQRVKWQYMVLDEAQAIKSSSSNRWKTLLGFDCRNRLLLTGTPVQNSMQELWALLHFIMPSLFDSHDEFSEWFSKDIESHAENKGTLNEHQLRRLHMILKPFMLRRIKKNVQNELGDKIEIDLYCEMSARQRALYKSLRSRVSVTELIDKAQNANDEAGLKSLMNLVMQFRKVCNHPELFERADVEAPFAFANFAKSGSLAREGDLLTCSDSTASLIEYQIPKLLCREGIVNDVGEKTRGGFDTHYLGNLFNIWRSNHIHESMNSTFAFAFLLSMTPADLQESMHGDTTRRVMQSVANDVWKRSHGSLLYDDDFAVSSRRSMGDVCKVLPSNSGISPSYLTSLDGIASAYSSRSALARRSARSLITPVVAPPVSIVASDGPFTDSQNARRRDHLASQVLYGLTPSQKDSLQSVDIAQGQLPALPPNGMLFESPEDQLPMNEMAVPQMNKLIIDSSKLSKLDELLRKLKAEGHRVLIYFQMTRMIDLMEEYLIYKQYKYLRLDGSSKISDRRDMVTDWQTKPELFIFLLSTRAGGLGINLTAADTVIFYDHDWNPSNDSQAMDRAHRLGQTKQVTVYRLITKNTIDERIVQLARNKKEVQDIVVGNKAYSETGMAKPQELVSLLLTEEELAESIVQKKLNAEQNLIEEKAAAARSGHAKRKAAKAEAAAAAIDSPKIKATSGWELEEDEDDFFGARPVKPVVNAGNESAIANGKADRSVSRTSKDKKKSTTSRRKVEAAATVNGENEEVVPPKKKSRPSKSQKAKVEVEGVDTTTVTPAEPLDGDESMM